MIVCPHCHKDLVDDSTFCSHCGRPLKKNVVRENKESHVSIKTKKKDSTVTLAKNPRANNWAKLGLMIFFLCLFGLDFLLSTLINALGYEPTFIFIISLIGYGLAITCGIMSCVIDYSDKKKGYQPCGDMKFALVAIGMSVYIGLVNLTQVIF